MKKKYRYFVFYQFTDPLKGSGYGNTSIDCDDPVDNIDRVRVLETVISDAHFEGKTKIVLCNWQRFEDK